MKDTVTRITFLWVGFGVGWAKGSHFVSLDFAGEGVLAKNLVVFLCTKFCLNHVQMVLKKKKRKEKENVCILY